MPNGKMTDFSQHFLQGAVHPFPVIKKGWDGLKSSETAYRNNSFAFSTEQAFLIAAAAIMVMSLLTFLA